MVGYHEFISLSTEGAGHQFAGAGKRVGQYADGWQPETFANDRVMQTA